MNKFIFVSGNYGLTKIGHDTNGNWSYWIKTVKGSRQRAMKIQHGDLGVHGHKITKGTLNEPVSLATFNLVVDAYRIRTGYYN